ncbi:MAG: flagellar biosynthetic protein FliR, partial [Pseudomonadota bacterium]
MTLDISIQPIVEALSMYLWPFLRIGAFLIVMPVIGASFVPTRVRILLEVVLTMVVAPVIQTPVSLDVLSAAGLVTV